MRRPWEHEIAPVGVRPWHRLSSAGTPVGPGRADSLEPGSPPPGPPPAAGGLSALDRGALEVNMGPLCGRGHAPVTYSVPRNATRSSISRGRELESPRVALAGEDLPERPCAAVVEERVAAADGPQ